MSVFCNPWIGKIYDCGFVYSMSEHCLERNHCIWIRNELHLDKMHACCMIQCFNFDQLPYKYTLAGKRHPTDHDNTAVNTFIQADSICLNTNPHCIFKFVWSFRSNACLLWKINKQVLFTEKILLNHFWSFHIADKCRPSISVRKTTTMSEKKLTTQLALLKYA